MSHRRDANVAITCLDISVARAGGARAGSLRVVEGASFTVPHGGSLAAIGPTGSGKSSLLAVLSGRAETGLAIAGGEGFVHGIPLRRPGRDVHYLTYIVGYLAQGSGARLPARLTVGEAIALPITSRDRKVNARALAVRTASLLDEMQLPLGAAAKYPYELSAGMRQRVAFARALVLQPRVLVADDPLASLDIEVRHVVRDAIVRRRDAYGMATVIATNDLELVHDLAAHILVLREGHVVAQDAGAGLIWTPGAGTDQRLVAS